VTDPFDYSKRSESELRGILEYLDRDRFPERAARIDARLEQLKVTNIEPRSDHGKAPTRVALATCVGTLEASFLGSLVLLFLLEGLREGSALASLGTILFYGALLQVPLLITAQAQARHAGGIFSRCCSIWARMILPGYFLSAFAVGVFSGELGGTFLMFLLWAFVGIPVATLISTPAILVSAVLIENHANQLDPGN
jgi:plasmid stabilization system protein ParE